MEFTRPSNPPPKVAHESRTEKKLQRAEELGVQGAGGANRRPVSTAKVGVKISDNAAALLS